MDRAHMHFSLWFNVCSFVSCKCCTFLKAHLLHKNCLLYCVITWVLTFNVIFLFLMSYDRGRCFTIYRESSLVFKNLNKPIELDFMTRGAKSTCRVCFVFIFLYMTRSIYQSYAALKTMLSCTPSVLMICTYRGIWQHFDLKTKSRFWTVCAITIQSPKGVSMHV